jgi:transcriptional regulator with GAF, ATPase, and Fis domain
MHLGQIVGTSQAIQRVLKQTELVSPTDANVLILGESGTGKELIASAIHQQSDRRHGPLIRVNCGAIPRDLFESEFFGHVKGAFSGALKDRPGRFEMADGGTLFLDEIGELPLDLQCKLLRVLQEGQFERLGDDRVRNVDVRIIAATNRNLETEVRAKRFRQDLYYRLNVVPIRVPALRERVEDIPQLITHFVGRCSQKLNRRVPSPSPADMLALQNYQWPGNIRELQNIVERAVIFSAQDQLHFDLPEQDQTNVFAEDARVPEQHSTTNAITTERERKQQERGNIVAALEKSNGKIYGPQGAAALLGTKPTTLAYRIKVLGIKK